MNNVDKLDQALKKLVYIWDKQMETLNEVVPEVEKNLKYAAKNKMEDLKKSATVAENILHDETIRVKDYLRRSSNSDILIDINNFVDDYEKELKSYKNKIKRRVKAEELKYDVKSFSDKVAMKQQEAEMHFKASLDSLKDALNSFQESVQHKMDEIKDSLSPEEE